MLDSCEIRASTLCLLPIYIRSHDKLSRTLFKRKSVDFTVKYLAPGCQFFYRYLYGRLPVEHF